jgi:hypothetical protein
MSNSSGPLLKSILAVSLLGCLLVLGNCGYKDKPVPPTRLIPKPVIDLECQLDEKGATLQWSYPNQTVTGDQVTEISGFGVYRYEVAEENYCKTCPMPFDSPMNLPGGVLASEGTKTASYQATLLRPGYLYFFKVRSKIGWWIESQDSNIVSFLWKTPPIAPEGVAAIGGDGKNGLKWNPVSRRQDGTPLTDSVQYQIHRKVDNSAFAKVGPPIVATSYNDTGVENGKVYSYQVQEVAIGTEGTAISGPMSASVNASPSDKSAPPPPGDVQGLRTDVGVKIFWSHVEGGDLGGYRVYRRTAAENKAKFVGDVKLPYTLFVDQNAPLGVELFYTVTSIDTQNPANESAKSSEIKIFE